MKNEIYLRRRGKVIVPAGTASEPLFRYVASIKKNVEALGYTFSQPMVHALLGLTLEELTAFYDELIPMLRKMRGAHRAFKLPYPNFPKQVMGMGEFAGLLNLMVQFEEIEGDDGDEKEERLPLAEEVKLTVIDLGNETEFQALFGQIVGSNTSLSDQDKADIDWYLQEYGTEVGAMMPASIPQKETQS